MLAYTAFKKHFQEDDWDISYISKKKSPVLLTAASEGWRGEDSSKLARNKLIHSIGILES